MSIKAPPAAVWLCVFPIGSLFSVSPSPEHTFYKDGGPPKADSPAMVVWWPGTRARWACGPSRQGKAAGWGRLVPTGPHPTPLMSVQVAPTP